MKNLYEQAKSCFLMADPDEKLAKTLDWVSDWESKRLEWTEGSPAIYLEQPGRLNKPEIVAQRDLPRRRLGSVEGKASMVHALAHIELTAVNLSLDAVYRYRDMPREYYNDWILAAGEEATHFFALREQLNSLGFEYGDFPAHEELWQMAINTEHDLMHRMGVTHRIFEARALDVVPLTIKKFENVGDKDMIKVLNMIANDEIGHVSAATRWFRYRCEQNQLDPDTTFLQLIKQYVKAPLKKPINVDLRRQSGFSEYEIERLLAADY